MRRWLVSALALGLCSAAFAQVGGDDPERQRAIRESVSGMGLKIGAYIPTDDDVQEEADWLLNLGVEYHLERPVFGASSSYLLLDYLGGDFTAWGLTFNQMYFTGDSFFGGYGKRSYFYFGAGIMRVEEGDKDTVFAGRGGIGMELGRYAAFEVGLFLAEDVEGVNPSGVQAGVVWRFP